MPSSEVDDDRQGEPRLVRFVFTLPSYIPLPDGTVTDFFYPSDAAPATSNLIFARVCLHQIALKSGIEGAGYLAMNEAVKRIAGTPTGSSSDFPVMEGVHTVADVITRAQTRDVAPAEWDGRSQHLRPEDDAVMRAVDSVRRVARAVRLCELPQIVLPAYENLPLMWMHFSAPEKWTGEGLKIPSDTDWRMMGLLLLEHTNLGFSVAEDPERLETLLAQTQSWAFALDAGSPMTLARERLIIAHARLHQDGDYAEAVVSAATATEVFTDALISALLWEERLVDSSAPDADEAAARFIEGKGVARATVELSSRLGGNWTGPGSAWQAWLRDGARLRNRIVHGGYQPSRSEADAAVTLAHQFQKFAFDRLAGRTSEYPRVILMFIGQPGLERRGLYNGKIESFNNEVAGNEPSWVGLFGEWHSRLVQAMP